MPPRPGRQAWRLRRISPGPCGSARRSFSSCSRFFSSTVSLLLAAIALGRNDSKNRERYSRAHRSRAHAPREGAESGFTALCSKCSYAHSVSRTRCDRPAVELFEHVSHLGRRVVLTRIGLLRLGQRRKRFDHPPPCLSVRLGASCPGLMPRVLPSG